jgi:hypothetical protein
VVVFLCVCGTRPTFVVLLPAPSRVRAHIYLFIIEYSTNLIHLAYPLTALNSFSQNDKIPSALLLCTVGGPLFLAACFGFQRFKAQA